MRKTFMGILFTALILLTTHAWAANYDNPVNGIFKGAYGDSISVEIPSTVSKSPDSLASGDLSFKVDSRTTYKDFNQLADLKTGDPVSVEYVVEEKTKRLLATTISKPASTTTTTTTTSTASTGTTNATPGQGVPTGSMAPAQATVGSTTSTVPSASAPSTTTTTVNSTY